MVAFSGGEPIGVLIGAKRPSATLIHRIAVHPDHRRQGHGRHLLESLCSKLAILGPPRIIAELPDTFDACRALFQASGYVEETMLTDYVWQGPTENDPARLEGAFEIPVTLDDLSANGLVGDGHPYACWERSVETLTARKNEVAGLAAASDERIEAYVLYKDDGEIVSLNSYVEDRGARLRALLSRLASTGRQAIRIQKVHPQELSAETLDTTGFRPAGEHLLYSTDARPQ
jgi:hypothetical protein